MDDDNITSETIELLKLTAPLSRVLVSHLDLQLENLKGRNNRGTVKGANEM